MKLEVILTFMLYKTIIISTNVNEGEGTFVGASEEIIKMAKENNGTVTTAMVVAAGFSRGNIKYLVDKKESKIYNSYELENIGIVFLF